MHIGETRRFLSYGSFCEDGRLGTFRYLLFIRPFRAARKSSKSFYLKKVVSRLGIEHVGEPEGRSHLPTEEAREITSKRREKW